MDESTFMIEYWNAKAKLINQLSKDGQYASVIVIDDDPIVCSMCERLKIEVYGAELLKHIPKQILAVKFRVNQSMSELLIFLRNQQVRTKKTIQQSCE